MRPEQGMVLPKVRLLRGLTAATYNDMMFMCKRDQAGACFGGSFRTVCYIECSCDCRCWVRDPRRQRIPQSRSELLFVFGEILRSA